MWSHPKNGIYLASCSYDGSVVIHKEVSRGRFDAVYTFHENNLSINCVAWAPHELGLVLCCGSADGVIYLLSFKRIFYFLFCIADSTWEKKSIKCCNMGINSISWAPFHHLGYQDKSNHPIYRFVCGSSDNVIRIYCSNNNAGGSNAFGGENEWKKEIELSGHKDSVRSVSWSPSCGLPSNTIASGGNDKQVMIWSQNELDGEWSHKSIATMTSIVWNVNWNHSGQCLAVASGDEDVCLFKQNIEDKEWEKEQIS